MAVNTTLKDSAAPRADGARTGAYLYQVLNCAVPAELPRRHALAQVDEVLLGRGEARTFEREDGGTGQRLTLRFVDRWMSGTHARLHRVGPRWVAEDAGSTNGLRVNGLLQAAAELQDGDVLELGRTFLLFRAHQLQARPDLLADEQTLTLLPDLEQRLEQLAQVLRTPVPPPVMVLGEPGVGKERAARLAHALSGRRGAFVPVNCGAFPPDLVASTLFGHVKGAFTGATDDRAGLVKAAHQGTLFLDEVGELPPAAQPYLLRALQEREVLPVGGTRAVPVEFQLVTATNRDLAQLQHSERFRGDLLGRLAGFTLTLPPLRERREDLGLLVRSILAALELPGVTLGVETARALLAAPWPGNIRELERSLQVAGALAQGGVVRREHLPDSPLTPAPGSRSAVTEPDAVGQPLSPEDVAIRDRLLEALKANRGNISQVARDLGKARMQIQRWIKRFEVDPEAFR